MEASLRRSHGIRMASLALWKCSLEGKEALAFPYKRRFRERFETSISSATRSYTFEVPSGWKEQVVSLNDGKLYGVDVRFGSEDGTASLSVAVLPYAGREDIREAGTPEEAFETFAPLLQAMVLEETDPNQELRILGDGEQVESGIGTEERIFFRYELDRPHAFVKAHAAEGQLYLMATTAKDRQWKAYKDMLRQALDSFDVPNS